jgi:hypothetical protein
MKASIARLARWDGEALGDELEVLKNNEMEAQKYQE